MIRTNFSRIELAKTFNGFASSNKSEVEWSDMFNLENNETLILSKAEDLFKQEKQNISLRSTVSLNFEKNRIVKSDVMSSPVQYANSRELIKNGKTPVNKIDEFFKKTENCLLSVKENDPFVCISVFSYNEENKELTFRGFVRGFLETNKDKSLKMVCEFAFNTEYQKTVHQANKNKIESERNFELGD